MPHVPYWQDKGRPGQMESTHSSFFNTAVGGALECGYPFRRPCGQHFQQVFPRAFSGLVVLGRGQAPVVTA